MLPLDASRYERPSATRELDTKQSAFEHNTLKHTIGAPSPPLLTQTKTVDTNTCHRLARNVSGGKGKSQLILQLN